MIVINVQIMHNAKGNYCNWSFLCCSRNYSAPETWYFTRHEISNTNSFI